MNLQRIFLLFLDEWKKLYCQFSLIKSNDIPQEQADLFGTKNVTNDGSGNDNNSDEADGEDEEVFEVEKFLGICYGDPKKMKKHTNYVLRYLNFKPKFKVICGKCLLSMLFRPRVSISTFLTHVNFAFD